MSRSYKGPQGLKAKAKAKVKAKDHREAPKGLKGVPSPGPPGARTPPLSGGCTPLSQALVDTIIDRNEMVGTTTMEFINLLLSVAFISVIF